MFDSLVSFLAAVVTWDEATYFALFFGANDVLGPLSWVFTVLTGLLFLLLLFGRLPNWHIASSGPIWLSALMLLSSGVVFHALTFSEISAAAPYFAGLFVLQAGLMILWARGRSIELCRNTMRRFGGFLMMFLALSGGL